MENRSFYNEILTEHNIRPEFKHDLPDANIVLEGVNPNCGDDIMLGMIVGKTEEEALKLGKLFLKMIQGEATDEEIDELEEASALKDISHMPARVKCAVLGWHTLEEALKK